MSSNIQTFVSLSEIGRLSNTPASRLKKAFKSGVLVPDFQVGKAYCFNVNRLAEIKTALATYVVR